MVIKLKNLKQLLIVAEHENKISIRRGWSIALTVLFGILAFSLVFFGGSTVGPTRFTSFLISLLYLVTYLVPLGALVYGYDLIAGEEDILESTFSLPVSREKIILGKYLGRSFSLIGSIIIGFGLAIIGLIGKPGFSLLIYILFIFVSVLLGLAFLSLSCLVSVLSPTKTYSLGGSLVLWLWFVVMHDLVSISILSSFDIPDLIFSIFIVLNPTDIFRVIIIQSVNTSGLGASAIFSNIGLPSIVLIVFLIIWCIIPISIASKLINRKNI